MKTVLEARGGTRRAPTPIWVSGRTRTLLLLGALVTLALVFWQAPGVLLVLAGGGALALVLSFPVRALSRLMPRSLAIATSFLALVLLTLLASAVVAPLLVEQLLALVVASPGIADAAERALRGSLMPLAERGLLTGTPDELMDGVFRDLGERARGFAQVALGGLVRFVGDAFGFAVKLLAALVVAGYLLADVRKIKAAYLRAVPTRYRHDSRELWDGFGLSLSRYLSGLAFVAAVQGVLAGAVLWALGVPYALVLGAWVSVAAVVPIIGSWVGAIPGVVTAFFVSPTVGVTVAVAFLAIQQLEGNFLTPKVLGGALGVHPILVLLAVVGGGQLAGLAGILLAIPALAVSRVLFDFLRPRLRLRRLAPTAGPSAPE